MKWKNRAVRLNHLFRLLVKTEADVEMLRVRTESQQSVWSCSWTEAEDDPKSRCTSNELCIAFTFTASIANIYYTFWHRSRTWTSAEEWSIILAFMAHTAEFVIYSLGAAAVATGDWLQVFSHFLFKAAFLFGTRRWSGGRPSLKCVDNPSIEGEEGKKVIPICMAFAQTEVFPEKSSSQIKVFCRLV